MSTKVRVKYQSSVIMFCIVEVLLVFFAFNNAVCQEISSFYKMIKSNSGLYRTEINSDLDPSWNKWSIRSYSFGFDPKKTPMPTIINGIISTPYMVQVRGNENEINKKRWGFHVFEGYSRDNMSRITMLLNKHVELGKPVAEMYYYGTEYNHSEKAYNWFRIGSDVKMHSFLFSRDKAIFYGSLKLNNALTLGNVGKNDLIENEPTGDNEKCFEKSSKYVNYKELKDSGNGTMFYDKDNDIVVIKVNGKWMQVNVLPLPESIKYDF